MINSSDIYSVLAKIDKIKLKIYDDKRPEKQKELAHECLDEVYLAINNLKAKL